MLVGGRSKSIDLPVNGRPTRFDFTQISSIKISGEMVTLALVTGSEVSGELQYRVVSSTRLVPRIIAAEASGHGLLTPYERDLSAISGITFQKVSR